MMPAVVVVSGPNAAGEREDHPFYAWMKVGFGGESFIPSVTS